MAQKWLKNNIDVFFLFDHLEDNKPDLCMYFYCHGVKWLPTVPFIKRAGLFMEFNIPVKVGLNTWF